MVNTEKSQRVYRIFQSISGGYDKANTRISLGMEKRWKQMLVDRLAELPRGAAVLDVCCGTGDIALAAAGRRNDLQVTGVDFSPAMLEVAQSKQAGLSNVTFAVGDAMALPCPDNSFDAVCISFGLRNTADYAQVLRELYRVAKPGGRVYCLDSFVPQNPIILPFYKFYFRVIMPRIGGGTRHVQEYKWLYESTQLFLTPGELIELFGKTGLQTLQSKRRLFGACVLIFGEKPLTSC